MSNLNLILNDEIFTDININEISEVNLVINSYDFIIDVITTGKRGHASCHKVATYSNLDEALDDVAYIAKQASGEAVEKECKRILAHANDDTLERLKGWIDSMLNAE